MEKYYRIGKNGGARFGKKGAGILFTDGKKVLLLKRADGDHQNTWGQPGGKVEDGETYIDAATRESKEECGQVKGNRIAEFEEKDGLHRWTTFIYFVEKPFKCTLSKEHKMWKWFNLDDLEHINLHPKFKENLDAYLRLIKNKINVFKSFKEWIFLRDAI